MIFVELFVEWWVVVGLPSSGPSKLEKRATLLRGLSWSFDAFSFGSACQKRVFSLYNPILEKKDTSTRNWLLFWTR